MKFKVDKQFLTDFLKDYTVLVSKGYLHRIPHEVWKKLSALEKEPNIKRLYITQSFGGEEIELSSDLLEPDNRNDHLLLLNPDNMGYDGFWELKYQVTDIIGYKNYNFEIIILNKSTETKKGKEDMNTNKLVNFDFGSCEKDNVKMSMFGLAVKDANGRYVSYDKNANDIVDVDCMTFDGGKFFYKMPVAIKDIAVGDVVIHNRFPMFVTAIADGSVNVIDISSGEKKDIMPTKNMFGFNFITKVVSLMDFCGGIDKPTADSPFGNMLPFLLMSSSNDKDNLLPLILMGGGNIASNPFMLYALMGNSGKENDLLPLMLMMNGMANKES